MSAWFQILDSIGEAIARHFPFVPDFPYRSYIFLAATVSFLVGILLSLRQWAREFRAPSLTRRSEWAEARIQKGDYAGAKELLIEMKAFSRAAQMALKLGQKEEALRLARAASDHLLVAQLLASEGRHDEAAQAYEQARRPADAAVQWEKIENAERALSAYRAAGNRRKVEELLRRLGRFEELGDTLLSDFEKFQSELGQHTTPAQMERLRTFANGAAGAYRSGEKFLKASEVYIRAGLLVEAAGVLEEGGDYSRAGDLYQQAGLPKDAARVLARAGRHERAAELLEEVGASEEIPKLLSQAGKSREAKLYEAKNELGRGNQLMAAALFAEAGDPAQGAQLFEELAQFARAAELWKTAGAPSRAAFCFESAKEYALAAPLYAEGGDRRKAADCYREAGEWAQACRLYEEGGDFFEAAKIAESEGDVDHAISLFQKIPESSSEEWQATHALARLFWAKGLHELSREKFLKICGHSKIEKERIPAFYDYAVFLEGTGELAAAGRLYEGILAIDFHYKDTLARKNGLQARLRPTRPSSPAADLGEKVELFQPKPGAIVAERYELSRQAGSGAIGVVYRGRDRKLGRDVAVKFVGAGLSSNDLNRLSHEAKVAAQLSHPNIVAVYDAGRHRDAFFLVMEYVDGKNLKEILEAGEAFSIDRVHSIALQVSSALAYAHGLRIIHRDVKSANILFAGDGSAKIADFGIARVLQEGELSKTQTLGSPLYAAPEQIRGGGIDQRADLYSLGIVLYELLTGKPPFTTGEVTHHHLHTAPPPIAQRRAGVPKWFEEIIFKLLEKDPSHRYPNATTLREALESRGQLP